MNLVDYSTKQMNTLRVIFHAINPLMVFMWKIGLGKAINFWPAVFGRIMIIKHRGRKSGKQYLTPVNYAVVDRELYCTAGFGPISDWYRNMLESPRVEVWLPEGKRNVCAEDISDSQNRLYLLRQVIIASGFAAPLFGVNPRKLNDEQLHVISKNYRLVHFKPS
jgi:deazaflavin-dependent oxidoreductase (nitroreductase family)